MPEVINWDKYGDIDWELQDVSKITKITVPLLKMYLHAHGLQISGLKPVLVERIQDHQPDCEHRFEDIEHHMDQEAVDEVNILEEQDNLDNDDDKLEAVYS